MSIPLLIGIIGHREILNEYRMDVEAELSHALDDLRAQVPNTPLILASSLAEGADRLGARVGLAKGLELIAPLPFEVEVFEQDFPDTVHEFRSLLGQARCSFVATESEFPGYEGASRWIARHCQIIIALWDGEEATPASGGTAHTVRLRYHVGEAGHTLASVADYLGPVLHLHCPRRPGVSRQKPRWIWPTDAVARMSSLSQMMLPLDQFNEEARKVDQEAMLESAKKLPEQLSESTSLGRAFVLADALANRRQRRFHYALNASVTLAVVGYAIQQAWVSTSGKIVASLFLTLALLIIYTSSRAKNHERYLEYRSLAEVLRIATFWRLAGVTVTPTDRFLNQHWGNLRWVRSAVNALWVPDKLVAPHLELVKARWIEDQQRYYDNRGAAIWRLTRLSRWSTKACFAGSVLLAWLAVAKTEWQSVATLGSGMLLLAVGAISHYAHTRGWEENASRYRSMATPFSWCLQIWRCVEEKTQRVLVQELGSECIAELSNWLLTHRNRPIDLIKG
ncbi:MAG: hypothetical protein AB1768_19330 [Pseudomonadota bacterium]|jgi:hypothetical protein